MDKTKYKTLIESEIFEFSENELRNLDLISLSNNEFSILEDHVPLNFKLLESDFLNATYKMEVAGETLEIIIIGETEQIISKLGIGKKENQKNTKVIAPMPGLILDLLVNIGSTVTKGDSIIIIEAMKMENTIKIQHNAVIKNILVQKGQSIEKGQILFELE